MSEELPRATRCTVGGNPDGLVMLCLACSYEWNHDRQNRDVSCHICGGNHVVDSEAFRDAMQAYGYRMHLE